MKNYLQSDNPNWITSSYCGNASCVEVAVGSEFVSVRDSKNRDISALVYTIDEWRDFVAGVKEGEFDPK